MESNFLKVDDFSCGYDSFKLDKISFNLVKASFTGIIGPNGSGKTTLFKGITQTLPTETGKISLNGTELQNLTSRERAKRIAIVSQFEPMGSITLMDYILMGRIPYNKRLQFFESEEDRSIAEHYMQLTGIYEHRNSRLSEMSGGEQQRAALARALTQQPELLLLDEPTAHLDITHQVRTLDLLQKLNEETDLTVLMVIHDLNLASEYCDRLILMEEGAIFTQGTPAEVIHFEIIEQVYKTPVITRINPYSGKPVVFLISEKMLKRKETKDGRRESGGEKLKD